MQIARSIEASLPVENLSALEGKLKTLKNLNTKS